MKLETVEKMKIEKGKDAKSVTKADLEGSSNVQSLLPSDSKGVPTTKSPLKKSREKPTISHSMVQPIEIVEEPPMGHTQAKAMTKLQVGNALLAVNAGFMTSDRRRLDGAENQGGTERQWQLNNTTLMNQGPTPDDVMVKERTMMGESQLARYPTEKSNEDNAQAGWDLSPQLQG